MKILKKITEEDVLAYLKYKLDYYNDLEHSKLTSLEIQDYKKTFSDYIHLTRYVSVKKTKEKRHEQK